MGCFAQQGGVPGKLPQCRADIGEHHLALPVATSQGAPTGKWCWQGELRPMVSPGAAPEQLCKPSH